MILDIPYAEMSFLRGLVKAKQYRIWKEEFAGRLKKGVGVKEANWLFNEIMNDMEDAIMTDQGLCANLLAKFRVLENEIQKAISGTRRKNEKDKV